MFGRWIFEWRSKAHHYRTHNFVLEIQPQQNEKTGMNPSNLPEKSRSQTVAVRPSVKSMNGTYMRSADRTPHTYAGVGPNFEYAVTSCQGWRLTQEDVHLVIPNFEDDTSLFAVFDGHNGGEVSTYVSKNLPDIIKRNRKYHTGQIVDGLKDAFLMLDGTLLVPEVVNELREIRRTLHPNLTENIPGFSSGCTAVVVLLKKRTIYCANLGDSRCVLCRNGRCFPLTRDHQPDDPQELTRIERAGGMVIRNRINLKINISRAFGDHLFKSNTELKPTEQMVIALPDVTVEPYKEDEDQFMLLMCDGIWNSIDMDELVGQVHQRIRKSEKLSAITEDIIQKLLPKQFPGGGVKGMDNMTLMIVRFVKSGNNSGGSGGLNTNNRPRSASAMMRNSGGSGGGGGRRTSSNDQTTTTTTRNSMRLTNASGAKQKSAQKKKSMGNA